MKRFAVVLAVLFTILSGSAYAQSSSAVAVTGNDYSWVKAGCMTSTGGACKGSGSLVTDTEIEYLWLKLAQSLSTQHSEVYSGNQLWIEYGESPLLDSPSTTMSTVAPPCIEDSECDQLTPWLHALATGPGKTLINDGWYHPLLKDADAQQSRHQLRGQIRATATVHSVSLAWAASSSAATCVSPCTLTYNVYRGTAAGVENMTTPINSAPVAATSFSDTNVVLGQTYFYVVQAVETSGTLVLTSANSNEASATFPQAPAAPTGLAGTPN